MDIIASSSTARLGERLIINNLLSLELGLWLAARQPIRRVPVSAKSEAGHEEFPERFSLDFLHG